MTLHPWHAIRVLTNHESKINDHLTNTFALPTYFPTYEATWVYRGRKRTVTLPHLRGWLFARFPAEDPHLWHDIRQTKGVLSFLGGPTPTPIPDDHIRKFQDRLDMRDPAIFLPSTHSLRPGDRVTFTAGPWLGYAGIITAAELYHPRIRVKISALLGRDVEVSCSASWCSPDHALGVATGFSRSRKRRLRFRKICQIEAAAEAAL